MELLIKLLCRGQVDIRKVYAYSMSEKKNSIKGGTISIYFTNNLAIAFFFIGESCENLNQKIRIGTDSNHFAGSGNQGLAIRIRAPDRIIQYLF